MHRGHEALHVDGRVGRVPEERPSPLREPEDPRPVVEYPQSRLGGVRRKAHPRLGLAQLGENRLALERTDDHLAENAKAPYEHVRPLAVLVHRIEDDQVTDDPPGLDRDHQGGPDRQLDPAVALGLRFGRKIVDPRDANRPTLGEQRPVQPREHACQVDPRGHLRDFFPIRRDADTDGLTVGADRQQRAPVGAEEDPDPPEHMLHGTVEVAGRGREQRGRRV